MDEWQPLDWFTGYMINIQGEVRNDFQNSRIITPVRLDSGHVIVGLSRQGNQYKRSLAKLVAETFLPPPPRESFDTVIHLDGNLTNCHAHNLAYRPRWFAVSYHKQFAKSPYPSLGPFRVIRTGEIITETWNYCTREGLLFQSLVLAVGNQHAVFPTFERFEWI